MPQVFKLSTNTISRLTIFGALVAIALLLWGIALFNNSFYVTWVGVAREQPIQFSHRHHAKELGIDCRYCHTSVEYSSFANVPATQICMNCHSQIWAKAEMLAPVRESFRTGEPIRWVRIHDLPDFVYFDHSIHVYKGIGCATCHGKIDEMNLTGQAASLYMQWCLECHRHPERYVRPREEVFNMDWVPPVPQEILGAKLVEARKIERRDDCSVCHR